MPIIKQIKSVIRYGIKNNELYQFTDPNLIKYYIVREKVKPVAKNHRLVQKHLSYDLPIKMINDKSFTFQKEN